MNTPPRTHLADHGSRLRCLACGAEIEATYSRLGSLRCDDCRRAGLPLDPGRVATWRRAGCQI